MTKENNLKEQFKQAILSTAKVISDDYKIKIDKKNKSSKNIDFFQLDNLNTRLDFIKYRSEIDSKALRKKFQTRHFTNISESHFNIIIKAMNEVVKNGTGRNASIDSIEVCGKTGTVENKNFNDHSVFISFAPMNKPKIAIAVYVEFGTWGSKWAAPIASLMMENYINGSLSEKSIKKNNSKGHLDIAPFNDVVAENVQQIGYV